MHKGNPHLGCMFLTDDSCIATGFDKVPYLYVKNNDKWEMKEILDKGINNAKKTKIGGNSFKDKKVYFNSDFKLDAKVEMKESDTMHQNFINCLKVFTADHSSNKLQILCSSDINGTLNYWDVSKY